MSSVRQPAVAGTFYPSDPEELLIMVKGFLDIFPKSDSTAPKAIIVPHAGFIYSGSIAAAVYARIRSARRSIKRVVLLGPSHRVGFAGLATSSADYFSSPLGNIPIDKVISESLTTLPFVSLIDKAHQHEHSLVVQLPFLQTVLDDFCLVPIVAGDASPNQVGQLLDHLWGGPETLIVVSSDLSHYHDYETAQCMDQQTTRAIESLDWEQIGFDNACGRTPVNGLLFTAKTRQLSATTIDLRNSGDTAGSKDQVVGYGAYAFN